MPVNKRYAKVIRFTNILKLIIFPIFCLYLRRSRSVTYAKYAPVALGLEKTNSAPLSALARSL